MSESMIWQACWNRLEAAFGLASRSLQACNPRIWSQCGHRVTNDRPLEAWIEFKRVEDPARVEDVVVFFTATYSEQALRLTVDISIGEGIVLADGPIRSIDRNTVREREILDYVAEVERFLDERLVVLRGALC